MNGKAVQLPELGASRCQIVNLQSSICNRQSAIANQQSAISNQQIRNHQSPIRNRYASLWRLRKAGTSSGETGSNSAPGAVDGSSEIGGVAIGSSKIGRRENVMRDPPAAAIRSSPSCFRFVYECR